jgi:rhodanese-related sulfurtransferase
MKTQITLKELGRARAYFEDKLAFTTGPVDLDEAIKRGDPLINVVDVRRADDYAKGHIPGAVNLPKGRWDTLAGLKMGRVNVVYCYSQTCHLAANAALAFLDKGFPVMELEGGFAAWKDHGFDVETATAVSQPEAAMV